MNGTVVLHAVSRILAYFALGVAVLLALTLGTILARSPGKPRPYLDGSGRPIADSISEKGSVSIRGAELGFFIKGRDRDNPILLYLHGGMPDYFLTERYPTGLDKLFTVAWLDQRGAGMSFDPRRSGERIGVDDLSADIVAFTDYLRERFSRDKIYLMGHSGGSYLGIKVIERYPEAYSAYIGVSQISNQKLSEKRAYDFIVARYEDDPRRQKVYAELTERPFELSGPIPPAYNRYRDMAMHELGVGTTRDMRNVMTGIFLPSLLFTEYTFAEKIRLWRGKANSGISTVWTEIVEHDLSRESLSFKVPVYLLHGVHDMTCSYELAKDYFDRIEAPDKGFHSFSGSAHSPIFEEPDACLRIIESEILARTEP
ncbi:MAG: alpha/beta hydrolase [Spirochaetae bacterium HGW-Spirochaetae-3]|jgi:pimeloyl-ACP methyl ester carboxylesterase|nr:MAG: alpha/beta hydrolase [Spirochaetae bacterium HGW-Spirochaetae-3]